ncbi:LacI family DNA-binding transcriptional regulator [Tessaracoccus terricola]
MPNQLKRVTAADVARALGISRATVGYVLNDTPGQKISEATRRKVLEKANILGYQPNRAARALASGSSRIVLLLLPDWPLDHSMRAHLDETSIALEEAGYSLVTFTEHPGSRARPLWETLDPDVVMGLSDFTEEQLAAMRACGVRRIVEHGPPSKGQLGYAMGPKLQVEHLLERDRRRLAFAGSTDPRLAELVGQRRELAEDTHRQLLGSGLAAAADVDPGNVAATLAEWIAAGVDGVVAYNDDVAALVAGTALRMGVGVPDSLAVVGHDDSPVAQLYFPSLTSVRVDYKGMGRYLASLALAELQEQESRPTEVEFSASIVPRESS